MKFNPLLALVIALVAAGVTGWFVHLRTFQSFLPRIAEFETKLNGLENEHARLKQTLAQTEQDRDKLKADASEVHRLRSEISALKNANKSLEQKAAQSSKTANRTAAAPPTPPSPGALPTHFDSYEEMGAFIGNLRKKGFGGAGGLTPEERDWLQRMKPEMEKLEKSPAEFATVQASLIQAAAGITDPQKIEQIQQLIQKTYENAVSRGLDIPSRPADDPAWVQQRHQLDRRGTQAVQGVLNETERAAFDKAFLGVMGVDLGTGVDKSLYPPGFLGDPAP